MAYIKPLDSSPCTAHACNSGTLEIEIGRSEAQGHQQLHKFEASLGYMKLSQKIGKEGKKGGGN